MQTFIRMALRYLGARKLRTTLTTLSIVFGVGVIFAGNLIIPSLIDSLRRNTLSAAGAVDLTISAIGGSSFDAQPALERVAAVQGVAAVTGLLQQPLTLPLGSDHMVAQRIIVGVDPATIGQVRPIDVVEGRFLAPGDRGVVVLPTEPGGGQIVAVGDSITLPTIGGARAFTVVGRLAESAVPSPEILLPLTDAQAMLGTPGQISTIEAALTPGADRQAVQNAALAALGAGFEAGATSTLDALGTLDIAYTMFNLLGGLALFIGAFLIFNTFRTIVIERRHDLALLRTVGASRGQVTRLIMIESVLQGLIGTAIGLLLGAGLAGLLAWGSQTVLDQYLPGAQITAELTPSALVPALLAGMITALVAGYLPARQAGRVSPLEALRPVSLAEIRRAARWNLIAGGGVMALALALLLAGPRLAAGGAILLLVALAIMGPALVLPATRLLSPLLATGFAREGEIAQGNLTRQPGRAAVTASTLMIGLAVLVMIASVMGSMGAYVTELFNRNLSSDVLLLPQNIGVIGANLGAGAQLADELRALPEVAAVGTLRNATGKIGAQTVNVNGIDPATYPLVSALMFDSGDSEQAYAALRAGRGAIANSILAGALQLKVGDTVELSTPHGPQRYTIAGIGSDALNFKINTLFISQANLTQDFGRDEDLMLMIKLAPGADQEAAIKKIREITAAYPQFTVHNTAAFRQNLIDQTLISLRAAFVPLALVILLPAALGLLNTLTMNVLERTREIGIVRAIGATRRQVRRIVLAEALLVGLFGAATGVLAGIAMSYAFVQALGAGFGTTFPYSFPALALLGAIIVAIVLALVASALPARTAARLDIIRALQYE